MSEKAEKILSEIKKNGKKSNIEGMAKFGINTKTAFGTGIPFLRILAKHHKKQHELAKELWDTGYHEARILASMIDDPEQVTTEQMEDWVKDFNSWDVCDQTCFNLFDKTHYAYDKVFEWSEREEEFVKRAAFALIAGLAIHDKKAEDKQFIGFLTVIERESNDNRNYVKKAVNWALRQTGKRNLILNEQAIESAKRIKDKNNTAAKWIAADALKELTNPELIQKLKEKLSK